VSDVVKRLEGGSLKKTDESTYTELAKEIIDVIFNALRIARFYKLDLDDYFLDRLEKIRRKFSTLEKPSKIRIIKDRNELVKYREQQYGANYSREQTQEYDLYSELIGKSKKGQKLLDPTCGDGSLKRSFEKLGFQAYGADFAWKALSQASEKSPRNLVYALPDHLPYKDKTFDVVISRRTLHSLPKKIRQKAIQECCRVLKPNGIFICSVQNIEDKDTLTKYIESGVSLRSEPNTYVADVIISGVRTQRIKHFYTYDNLKEEIEKDTELKVVKRANVTSRAGWCIDLQQYIVVKAIRKA